VQAKGNAPFRRLLSDIRQHSTPVILATQKDKYFDTDASSLCHNISTAFRSLNASPFPTNTIFFVSAKQKLMGERGSAFFKTFHRKPDLDSSDPSERDLALDIAYTLAGFNSSEANDSYKSLTEEAFQEKMKKLIDRSQMNPPLRMLLGTTLQSSGYLTGKLAIHKSVEAVQSFLSYFSRLQEVFEAEENRFQDLDRICMDVSKEVREGIPLVKKKVTQELVEFKKGLNNRIKTLIDGQNELIKDKVECSLREQSEFSSPQEAIDHCSSCFEGIRDSIHENLEDLLDKENTLFHENQTKPIFDAVQDHILGPLSRISHELTLSQLDLQLPKKLPHMKIDLALLSNPDLFSFQKRRRSITSIVSKFLAGEGFGRTQKVVRLEIKTFHEMVKEAVKDMREKLLFLISQRAEKMITDILDSLFVNSILIINQFRGAILERSKLLGAAKEVLALKDQLEESSQTLKKSCVDVTLAS